MEKETTEKILADFLTERPLTIRCRTYLNSKEEIVKSLENQGVEVTPALIFLMHMESPVSTIFLHWMPSLKDRL